MRNLLLAAVGLATAVAVSPAAKADPNDFLGQAQRLFTPNNADSAYERGRRDEMQQQQAQRNQRRLERQQRDAQYSGDRLYRDDRYPYRGY